MTNTKLNTLTTRYVAAYAKMGVSLNIKLAHDLVDCIIFVTNYGQVVFDNIEELEAKTLKVESNIEQELAYRAQCKAMYAHDFN